MSLSTEIVHVFQEPFMQQALLVGCLSAGLCAFLGIFILLRKIVFVGIALAEVAALGIAAGMFLGISPVTAGFGFMMLGILVLAWPLSERRVSREGLNGLIYALCAALAVILVAKNPIAESRGLDLIAGNLLYAGWEEARQLLWVSAIVGVVYILFIRRIILVSFDRRTAQSIGLVPVVWDLVFYVTLGLVYSVTVQLCGVVSVFAALILPAMTGILMTTKMIGMFGIALITAVGGVVVGLVASYQFDLPGSPCIVVVYAGVLLFLVIGKGLFFKQ